MTPLLLSRVFKHLLRTSSRTLSKQSRMTKGENSCPMSSWLIVIRRGLCADTLHATDLNRMELQRLAIKLLESVSLHCSLKRICLCSSGLRHLLHSHIFGIVVPLSHIFNGKTPYELWFKQKPDVSHLRVWGCLAYVHV